jgi:integrase
VDPAVVPDLRQAQALIDYVDDEIVTAGGRGDRIRTIRHRYATFLRVILLSGMRPSEVSNLHVHNLHLPVADWGRAKVWGGTVVAGAHWTDTGARYDDSAQKWRDPDAPPRLVPLPPALVALLRDYIRVEGRDGRVFVNERGNPLATENAAFRHAWQRARSAKHPAAYGTDGSLLPRRIQRDPLFAVVPYDLRHTAASIMIAGGVPAAEIARRLGHSPDMLLRVYAGFFQGDEERGNTSMDAYYAANGCSGRDQPMERMTSKTEVGTQGAATRQDHCIDSREVLVWSGPV